MPHYKEVFPGLNTISERLLPGTNPVRPTIENYRTSLELQGRLTPAVKESLEKAAKIRSNTRAIVYIAGPLTGIDEQLKQRYEDVSKFLESYGMQKVGEGVFLNLFFGYAPHIHGTDPVKHPSVTPAEVRDIDYLWASVVADLHVNFLYPTGHGNAIEEGWAEKALIPSVYVNHEGHRLSRLVLGMNNVVYSVQTRDFGMDGYEKLAVFFDELATWMETFPQRDPREFFYLSLDFLSGPIFIESERSGDELTVPADDVLVYVRADYSPIYGNVGQLLWNFQRDISFRLENGENWHANPEQVSLWLK